MAKTIQEAANDRAWSMLSEIAAEVGYEKDPLHYGIVDAIRRSDGAAQRATTAQRTIDRQTRLIRAFVEALDAEPKAGTDGYMAAHEVWRGKYSDALKALRDEVEVPF